MPIICWGNLGKSADDNQRIEQSIQDYVENHNENENAHQVYGSSLYMHRIQDELDHLEGSVSLRYLSKDRILYFSGFESLDGWSTGGTVTPKVLGTTLSAPEGGVDTAYIGQAGIQYASMTDFTKNPFFQASVKCLSSSDQRIRMIRGQVPDIEEGDCFGFKIVGANLYAYWSSGLVEHTGAISGVDVTDLHVYRAYCDSANEKIYFFVDGVLKYTATSNYPTDENSNIFYFYVERLAAGTRTIQIIDLLLEQDR